MSKNNDKKNFTAADIEKYHKGLLSAKERHALEKAALDDPFLSDALEGYTTAGVYVADDMKDLNERLAERINEKRKVIAMPAERRRFALWKVAAIIVLIAGAGFLVYQFGSNKKENNIAETTSKKNETVSDTSTPINETPKQEISNNGRVKTESKNQPKEEQQSAITKAENGSAQIKTDKVSQSFAISPSKQVNAPAKDLQEQAVIKAEDKNAAFDQLSKQKAEDVKASSPVTANNNARTSNINGNTSNEKLFSENKKADKYVAPNVFRGRVLDANNNPIPFANITNIADSVGTYTDAKGNFNLISSDTLMNVEIRSVGFNNINTQLRNRAAGNNVVLQEDRSISANVLLDTAKSNAIKRLHAKTDDDEDEAEPEDSWGLYDTYIVNNLRVPDVVRSKQIKGQVEVSFEVDKNGDLTNFKITKSLCDECDKEAIRLIKEGPKWKRKAKKGKTSVTISF